MDRELACRLERTESAIGTSFTAVQQRVAPEVGAVWRDFDGTYAIYDGAESPMTQTFGLGMFAPTTPEQLTEIEAFFEQRGAPVMHEVSPLAGVATYAMLAERGYRPHELSTVLVLQLHDHEAPTSSLKVRVVTPADRPVFVETAIGGWASDATYGEVIRKLTEIASQNTSMLHFLVEQDGEPIASGSLGIHEGVALFAGASTIPRARGLGAQSLLLAARYAEARRRGCELAMMVCDPGSTSQRNAERRGFRVAYTRTKWRRAR
ncbi:MAG: GNAT family N-acetyltransferase [Kofleriaceae bacterium]